MGHTYIGPIGWDNVNEFRRRNAVSRAHLFIASHLKIFKKKVDDDFYNDDFFSGLGPLHRVCESQHCMKKPGLANPLNIDKRFLLEMDSSHADTWVLVHSVLRDPELKELVTIWLARTHQHSLLR